MFVALTCVARVLAYGGSVERSCGSLRDMPDQLWREVVVSRMVAVSGGYGGASQTVESKEILYEGRVTSFIRIC